MGTVLDRLQRFLVMQTATLTISVQGVAVLANASWTDDDGTGNLNGFNSWGLGDTAEEAIIGMLAETGF